MAQMLTIGLLLIATFIGSFGPIFLKKASSHLNREAFSSIPGFFKATVMNFSLIAGFFFYGTSFILYMVALSGSELSVVYPLVSLSYVWVFILSIAMLHEKMSVQKWLGIALIIIGATMVGLGS